MSKESRKAFLKSVIADVATTGAEHSALLMPNVITSPIPYFGNPSNAVVATLGVNPSAKEFRSPRWRAESLGAAELDEMLCRYFSNDAIPPHPWFRSWETCLQMLSHSYLTDAVHLDLSPRATRAMSSLDSEAFTKMIDGDLKWFFSALDLCVSLRAIFAAGTVTRKFYMDKYLGQRAAAFGWTLIKRRQLDTRRSGTTSIYDFVGPGRKIILFFCRAGPSGFDRGATLVSEVSCHLQDLAAAGF